MTVDVFDYELDREVFDFGIDDCVFYAPDDVIPDDFEKRRRMEGATEQRAFVFFCQVDSLWKIKNLGLGIFDNVVIDESVEV